MNKYRLYIDEVGNPGIKADIHPNERFLSLTGVIIELAYVAEILFPEMEKLKKEFFGSHPDEPIVFHRKELMNKKYPFHILQEENIEKRFNQQILLLLSEWKYIVITVVIDKIEHRKLYSIWQYDPYHYCMAVMLERFIFFLEAKEGVGDVMAESRGRSEDLRLKKSFRLLWNNGTEFIENTRIQNSLTSKELKVKPKANNVSGLQLADLIAHPSRRAILRSIGKLKNVRTVFGDRIEEILQGKYYKSSSGKIWGYGKKILP